MLTLHAIALVVATAAPAARESAPVTAPLDVRRVVYDPVVDAWEQPVRIRVTGFVFDQCYRPAAPVVTVDRAARRIDLALHAVLYADKPCREQRAWFQVVALAPEVPPGVYVVRVNGAVQPRSLSVE